MEWKASDRIPPVDTLVGVNDDQALVFVRDRKQNVVALSLASTRVRTYLTGSRAAAVGAEGTLYTVDSTGAIHQYARRSPRRFRARFSTVPVFLHGTMGSGVLGFDLRHNRLEAVGAEDSIRTVELAPGPTAVTVWGDLAAVAADTAVVVYDPLGTQAARSVRFRAGARAVSFSPSGHQLYVAQDDGVVAVLDRYGLGVLRRIELPGPARTLRAGPMGRWLLARPDAGDSIWVVDLEQGRVAGAVAASWSADLPLIGVPDVLIVRDGRDVVVRSLAASGLPERGRLENAAADLWALVAWVPAAGGDSAAGNVTAVPAAAPRDSAPRDSAPPSPGDSSAARAPAEHLYLQISSSRNPDWAKELAAKLANSGLPASVLNPEREGEPYRVVLGPYTSREEAEARGRSLGMPYFVISTVDGVVP